MLLKPSICIISVSSKKRLRVAVLGEEEHTQVITEDSVVEQMVGVQ